MNVQSDDHGEMRFEVNAIDELDAEWQATRSYEIRTGAAGRVARLLEIP